VSDVKAHPRPSAILQQTVMMSLTPVSVNSHQNACR